MELGAVKSVYENTVSQAPIAAYDYSNAKMMLESAGSGLAAPTISSGQNEVKVEVTLVYEVK